MRRLIANNVFDEAIDRMSRVYKQGHRVIVSFSAGKDSGVCLEICRIASQEQADGRVEVVMRDEEIMFPGTFEYAERIAQQPDIDFHWLIAGQPIINIYNRTHPYFWVFDNTIDPEEWVRQPPKIAEYIEDQCIDRMITPERYPVKEDQEIYSVMGLRVSESMGRRMGLASSGGYVTKPNKYGVRYCRPIYDFVDGDIWKSIRDMKWDYNKAYDTMAKLGVPRNSLRIAPPTLAEAGLPTLKLSAKAWPQWFNKVCKRLPGIKAAAYYGKVAVRPHRRHKESWEECFKRECITDAPAPWIAERATKVMNEILKRHASHSNTPLPQKNICSRCGSTNSAWARLARHLYNGDPFSMKTHTLPYIEPEFFREGAGTWGGRPSW